VETIPRFVILSQTQPGAASLAGFETWVDEAMRNRRSIDCASARRKCCGGKARMRTLRSGWPSKSQD